MARHPSPVTYLRYQKHDRYPARQLSNKSRHTGLTRPVEKTEMTRRMVNPTYAQELIEETTHEPGLMATLMRPIRPYHVDYLARQMERRNFGNNIIDIVTCAETGQRFLANGNHTLRAVVKSGVTIPLTVEQSRVETIRDVRRIYSQYDRGLSRSRKDAMRSLDADGASGLPLTHVGYLASAVAFMLDDYDLKGGGRPSQKIGDDELHTEMVTWVEEFAIVRNAVGTNKQWEARIIRRRGVLSVALNTARANRDTASRFWHGVASGVNLAAKSPELVLREYLTETGLTGGGGRGVMTTARDMARVSAHCWNKFINGERIARLYVPSGPVTVKYSSARSAA